MPMRDPQKIYRDLEIKEFAPLYFIFGEEPYLLNQCFQRFKKSVFAEGTEDFNYNLFYAKENTPSEVKEAVETLPMMSSRRLVILKEAQEYSDKEWNEFESLLTSPVQSTVFVILATKVDKRKKILKTLTEVAESVEFKKPYENQVPWWINYIAQSLEIKISEEAVHLLHTLVGSHLLEIESEILKLKEYVGDRHRIELSDVASAVSRSKEENIFDFTRAVGERDQVKALEHLVQLLDQGQSEVGVVALVARHIRLLMTVKKGLEMSLHGARLAQQAQVPSYFIESYVDQSRQWSMKKLEQTLVVLSETDKALKSSPLSSHIWLENMVLKACH